MRLEIGVVGKDGKQYDAIYDLEVTQEDVTGKAFTMLIEEREKRLEQKGDVVWHRVTLSDQDIELIRSVWENLDRGLLSYLANIGLCALRAK